MTQLPVLYFLPGLMCDAAVWEQQQAALSPYFDTRIADFRAFDDFRKMAESILAEAPAHFSVVAHSMGGRVALELVHLAPERIDKLVLMDFGAHPVQPGEARERMVLVKVAEEQGIEALAEAWVPPMLAPASRQDSELVQAVRTMVLRHTPAEYRAHIEAALKREDQSQYLPHIRQHVLVICGELDEWSTVSQHEEIVAALPDAELQVVPGAGHMVTMEAPAAVNALLLDYFGCLSQPKRRASA